jgi:branched-subunit amino acid aminotransferase/4-amino-4-deoxychorismate lyase
MVATQLYDNDIEWKQHTSAMQTLAKELHMPAAEISQTYEKTLKELKEQAKIKDFLVIFTCRRVKELLHVR